MTYNKNTWANHDLITSQKLNNIEDGINDVIDRVTYGTGGAEQPTQPIHTPVYLNLGDPLPTDAVSGDYAFIKDGDDFTIMEFNGVKWVEQINPNLKERIADVLAQAETRSQELVDENATAIGATLDEVQAKQADLTAKQAELDTKAQGYANKALADAKANTLATATQTAKDASDALAKAKTDLTTSLNKEVTDRANAVTALDNKAKGYADTAKADAIATANGAVAKEVTDRQKAITDLDAKSTGAINQAKTDAQSALDALQVGGRNLVIKDKLVKGWMGDGVVSSSTSAHAMTTDFVAVAPNSSLVAQIWYDNTQFDVTNNYLRVAFYDSNKTYITRTPLAGTGSTTYNKWLITTPANTAFVRMSFDWLGDGYGHAKLEQGTKATDYTQAPEDIVLDYTTKDNVISQSLTQYQATNDGKVTKAQSDATQALGLVATKVSQTDYNTKTGDLDSKYTAVKQTADQASTDIVAIKSTNTSQDTKINTLTSDVSGTKQSISDIQTEQGKQSTKINTIQTDVSGTKQDISDIKDANGVQDGKIASISTTVDGLSSSFSTYKTTNDGKVAKAQADITANATAISQKVSQTAYDAKTGQLQTDLNTTTTTANQAKTDIVAIKSDNTKQDARMTTIESDANGTKTTVSNLQTDLGKANGSISTLQQRADGFEATVTKVNNLSVGGRNLFLNSKTLWNVANNGNGSTKVTFDDTTNMWHITAPAPVTAGRGIYFYQTSNTSKPLVKGDKWAMSIDIKGTGMLREFGAEGSTNQTQPTGPIPSEWTRLSSTGTAVSTGAIIIYFGAGADTTQALDVYVKLPKLELGTIATAWSPAPEDVDSATAKAQFTADQATLSINNYKTDADGRISKAQADIIVNANAITQKVSQSDYNAKTGDLTTKVNTAQSTADSATSTIGAYKTSNDARVASAESKITANANAITQKVSQSDYNQKTGELSGKISEISQTAGQISQSVSDVKAQVDGLSVGGTNLLLDTAQYAQAGTIWSMEGVSFTDDGPKGLKSTNTSSIWGGPEYRVYNLEARGLVNTTDTYVFSVWVKNTSSNTVNVSGYGDVTWIDGRSNNIPANSDWVRIKATFRFNKATGNHTNIRYEPNVSLTSGVIKLAGHKLEFGNMATDWTPAPEDVDNKISTVSQTVRDITSIVSDPTTGLTKRVQTAEGTLSQVTGADIPSLQKATYWQPFTSLDLNTYMKQGSFFFNSTAVKPNAPTTKTNWMYLVVEQGTSDSGRVVQTAWYDTQTDAKITYRRQYAGAWSPWYANDNDSVTSISQTNGAIQQEVKDRTNGDSNTLTQAKDFTTSSISNSESGMKSLVTQTSDAILGKVGAVNLFPNSEFEKDYGYRTKNPGVTLSLDTKSQINTQYNGTVTVKATNAGWQGYWARNIEVQGGQKYSGSVLVHYTNGGVTGGYATLDRWFVDKDGNRINGGVGGTGKGTVGEVTSPYWTQLYFEGVTAPDNAVNLQVSLLTNDKGVGQTAIFTQPMVTATEKLQPYTPNNDITTQLALLKDNWSIGIADNAGAITNGIVGNSTNMSLISNNVVINAPSTQIKGTAWINSAMIANGAIGTAQIGDASITSAKIASLDVAKLTGNVSSFIQSNWNGVFASTMIDNTGMSINGGNTTTKFDTSGAHYSNSSGVSATYSFGKWSDSNGNATSATGLYLGATGSENSFINILGTNGAAAAIVAGSAMDFGSNLNVVQGAFNFYTHVNIRERLMFKANRYVGGQPSYIEINENTRTFNFFTGGGSQGGGNYFYFSQNVLSAGTFSSTSRLSQKIVDSPYTEDALGEISKTQLVNFAYKNRPDQNHVSPIIDDVNDNKEYYIPKTILGQDGEYVDMYSMISMTWKALQQVNDRLKKLESR